MSIASYGPNTEYNQFSDGQRGWNYGTTAIAEGTPVARDISRSTTIEKAHGIATVSTTNAHLLLGIAQANDGISIPADAGGTVVTRGIARCRVQAPANVAIADGDLLTHVPGETYLRPFNLQATVAGVDRGKISLLPFAIAREAVASLSTAQVKVIDVEVLGESAARRITRYSTVITGNLAADLPTTPATNFVPLGTVPFHGRVIFGTFWARISGVDATDPLNIVMRGAKHPRNDYGNPVQLFSTNPRLGGDTAGEDPAAGFDPMLNYDGDDAIQGVFNTANTRVAPGDRLGFSLDITRTTPDTEAADVVVEFWVLSDF